ncbi:MAG: TetR/AcrR family transcriptional regulator [Myxococcota bacterium]
MARPSTISDEQILNAARAEFMERGFQASTAAIARRAGVSEGTVFKRFPSKEKLFLESMDFQPVDEVVAQVDVLAQRSDPGSALEELMVAIIQRLRIALPRMMMLWANTVPERLFAGMAHPPPARILSAVRRWLEVETNAGRLTVSEPEATARLILGSCIHFVFFEATGLSPGGTARDFAQAARTVLFRGIEREVVG